MPDGTTGVPDGAASPPVGRYRRPWLAAVLSFLCPGLGQIFCRCYLRGGLIWAGCLGLYLLAGTSVALLAPSPGTVVGLLLPFFVGLLLWLGNVVDAWLLARRVGAVTLGPLNRPAVYAAIVLLAWLLPEAIQGPKAFSLPSGSMLPGFAVGDRVLAWPGAFERRPPARGDLAVFGHPRDPAVAYFKRIVGLPGDRVAYRDGRLVLNGAVVPRVEEGVQGSSVPASRRLSGTVYRESLPDGASYLIAERGDAVEHVDDTEVFEVPPGHVFVLGDNRDSSRDSRVRRFGFVPVENLHSRPVLRYWSRGRPRFELLLP